MAVGRLSISIADGPMQHIKASDSGLDVAMVRRHYDERFIRMMGNSILLVVSVFSGHKLSD